MSKILFAFLIAGLFILPVVFAEDANQTQTMEQLTAEEQATVSYTPDHPLYGLERAMERIRLMFTFNEQEKATMHTQLAYERLVEAKAMEQKNKTQFVAGLVKDYENEAAAAETNLAKAETRGQNVTQTRMHVQEMTAKHIAVLQRVMANAPESAQSGLQTALQNAEQLQLRIIEEHNTSTNNGGGAPVNGGNGTEPVDRQEAWITCTTDEDCAPTDLVECIEGKCRDIVKCTTDSDCELSLCDCKCYKQGATPETGGMLCGINCLGEYNVSGCKCTNGECEIVRTQAQNNQQQFTPTGNIVNVEIKSMKFTPNTISIAVGDTVVWTNNEVSKSARHKIADSTSSKYMIRNNFGSGDLNIGDSYNYTFTQEGTFRYQCLIHPVETGEIIVGVAS